MALALRTLGRSCLLRQPSCILPRRSTLATRPSAYEEMNTYWVKNRQLNRPLSPHVTVVQYHVTMVVSITNRVAAVALQGGLCLASITLLCLPGTYTDYISKLRELRLGPAIVYGVKFLLALPFAYHLVAGMRHLVWDMGYGFSKPMTQKGSWVVLALTGACTAFLMFGVRPSAL
ncbi:succinate dehydrogenase cytochrome b560 subunit, mitochondrial [Aplysia californica]|uniref:Succinate dehydrogenase cytochrome b560 subunit, mitochondrial n=1 Tax=Aplysia californica TaxID=6500 RepID=A0ABM1AC05_APLCA|nr:succinate dehydrogenase cytochrome b560 subunit, mitochondrial [Aplysia californica]